MRNCQDVIKKHGLCDISIQINLADPKDLLLSPLALATGSLLTALEYTQDANTFDLISIQPNTIRCCS